MNYRYIFIGILAFIVSLVAFGIPTAIIPNQIYKRMIPATYLDWVFLVIISAMLGTYIGLYFYGKKTKQNDSKEDAMAGGSAITSFFALSCPVCISFLVAIFGTTALLMYYEPFRPVLGFMTLGVLSTALYLKINSIKEGCKSCS